MVRARGRSAETFSSPPASMAMSARAKSSMRRRSWTAVCGQQAQQRGAGDDPDDDEPGDAREPHRGRQGAAQGRAEEREARQCGQFAAGQRRAPPLEGQPGQPEEEDAASRPDAGGPAGGRDSERASLGSWARRAGEWDGRAAPRNIEVLAAWISTSVARERHRPFGLSHAARSITLCLRGAPLFVQRPRSP